MAQLEAEIDEYGELDRQLKLIEPLSDRHKALREKFQEILKTTAPEKTAVLKGRAYEIQCGTARNERTIVNRKKVWNLLKTRLGLDGLLALIDLPLGKAVDPHITKTEQKGLVVEERTGWRKLDVVALRPAEPSKAA